MYVYMYLSIHSSIHPFIICHLFCICYLFYFKELASPKSVGHVSRLETLMGTDITVHGQILFFRENQFHSF